jgi:hypothetical protein
MLKQTLSEITTVEKYCFLGSRHCNENPIYVFPEKELRGLSPNFHIHVSVTDLYISRIGPHIFLQQNRQTHRGNICINRSQTREWKLGLRPLNSFSGNNYFAFSVLCFCSGEVFHRLRGERVRA